MLDVYVYVCLCVSVFFCVLSMFLCAEACVRWSGQGGCGIYSFRHEHRSTPHHSTTFRPKCGAGGTAVWQHGGTAARHDSGAGVGYSHLFARLPGRGAKPTTDRMADGRAAKRRRADVSQSPC